ncbi:hypothetical protein GGR53DRAFT_470055 [Hypoxylon sp. FL1150]|nr:hypothetical protein GGR53DRAFT_470055 [Hypoxylon sp. FL1150]
MPPAAITAVTATAAITSSAGAYRYQDRLLQARSSDEDPPWKLPQQRLPFTSTRFRHSLGYHSQPLYYPASIHQHYAHHAGCPGSQCHYRAFLTDSIRRYNESRRELRQTYVANLRELRRVHASQPQKPAAARDAEADRLYAYYVSRVRAVFDEHRHDHRCLFGHDYLCWTPPEREGEQPERASGRLVRSCGDGDDGGDGGSRAPGRTGRWSVGVRSGDGGGAAAAGVGVGVAGQLVQGRTTTTVIRERTREGTGCDGEEEVAPDEQRVENS